MFMQTILHGYCFSFVMAWFSLSLTVENYTLLLSSRCFCCNIYYLLSAVTAVNSPLLLWPLLYR